MSLPLHLTERARAEALQRHLNDALKEKGEMRGQLIKARHQLEVELRNAVTLRQKLATMHAKERENKQRQDCLVTSTEEGQLREELARTRQELLREMESTRQGGRKRRQSPCSKLWRCKGRKTRRSYRMQRGQKGCQFSRKDYST